MNKIFNAVYLSPIGDLGIQCEKGKLHGIEWIDSLSSPFSLVQNDSSEQILELLDHYFLNKGRIQKIPDMLMLGTDFQKRVWNFLLTIPVGNVLTYGEIAKKLKTSSRAIGQACKTNRIPIIIPCHRIVSSNGLGGFMGKANRVDRKRWLLEHEGYITI